MEAFTLGVLSDGKKHTAGDIVTAMRNATGDTYMTTSTLKWLHSLRKKGLIRIEPERGPKARWIINTNKEAN